VQPLVEGVGPLIRVVVSREELGRDPAHRVLPTSLAALVRLHDVPGIFEHPLVVVGDQRPGKAQIERVGDGRDDPAGAAPDRFPCPIARVPREGLTDGQMHERVRDTGGDAGHHVQRLQLLRRPSLDVVVRNGLIVVGHGVRQGHLHALEHAHCDRDIRRARAVLDDAHGPLAQRARVLAVDEEWAGDERAPFGVVRGRGLGEQGVEHVQGRVRVQVRAGRAHPPPHRVEHDLVDAQGLVEVVAGQVV